MKNNPLDNQSTIVKEKLGEHAAKRLTYLTEKIALVGAEGFLSKNTREIADTLANILKSRSNIVSIKYDVGSPFVEVTSESDLSV